ncbi:MAG TPA: FCD domain-containing protein [Marmoricola sp.]|jgi:DNA-binding FadR family transcriptional regulator|nr:FCD domain-containing protein [Marmoricola sp.]
MTQKETSVGSRTGSRAESVADAIERRIGADALAEGDRLGTKESLRLEFGVAVATLNEAIRILADRGLVDVRPGVKGGIFVASRPVLVRLGRKMLELSGDSVSVADCLVMRNALEPLILREAARFVSPSSLGELRDVAKQMARPGLGADEYLEINWRLHMQIADITPSQVLRHTYQSLLEFVQSRVRRVAPDHDEVDVERGARIHYELVEAIGSGDPARLDAALDAHSGLTATLGDA